MLIIGASESDIWEALRTTNERFDGNVRFDRFDSAGVSRDGQPKFNVTLKPVDSRAPGSRTNAAGNRRVNACCWHVFGVFMDSLPWGCEIVTASPGGRMKVKPGDSWAKRDGNVGSMVRPAMASSLCDCEGF